MKKIDIVFKVIATILFLLSGLAMTVHGIVITNSGELIIGVLALWLSWMLFTDSKYEKSIKEMLTKMK